MEKPYISSNGACAIPQVSQDLRNGESARKAGAVSSDVVKQAIARMSSRVQDMGRFHNISFSEFVNRLPLFEQAARTLSQSLQSVAYAVLRQQGETSPRNSYEIITCCEKRGILPYHLAKPLASFILMVDNGFDMVGSDDVIRIQKDLPRLMETLRQFSDILFAEMMEEKVE